MRRGYLTVTLRMVKLKQKISGTMRIHQGAQDFATIRSYLQTGLKQGQNPLHILITLFEGRPWLPATTRPVTREDPLWVLRQRCAASPIVVLSSTLILHVLPHGPNNA